jgi:hypothetical protein
LEVERKFDVGVSDVLPPFTSIAGVDSVGTAVEQKLDAVYFDTATLALAGRRISLRRRTGGQDPGWHLKLPVAMGERREIMEPLNQDPDTVPPRLQGLVLVHARSQKLVPVAEFKTHRSRPAHQLHPQSIAQNPTLSAKRSTGAASLRARSQSSPRLLTFANSLSSVNAHSVAM